VDVVVVVKLLLLCCGGSCRCCYLSCGFGDVIDVNVVDDVAIHLVDLFMSLLLLLL
jgi:hypothetical protein